MAWPRRAHGYRRAAPRPGGPRRGMRAVCRGAVPLRVSPRRPVGEARRGTDRHRQPCSPVRHLPSPAAQQPAHPHTKSRRRLGHRPRPPPRRTRTGQCARSPLHRTRHGQYARSQSRQRPRTPASGPEATATPDGRLCRAHRGDHTKARSQGRTRTHRRTRAGRRAKYRRASEPDGRQAVASGRHRAVSR